MVSPACSRWEISQRFRGTEASAIPVWDFGFTQIQMIGYQGQVIAAMMAGFVLVYLEKFFRKHCPAVISMIVVPFCSLIPRHIPLHVLATENELKEMA